MLVACIASGVIGVEAHKESHRRAVSLVFFYSAIMYSLFISALVTVIAIAVWGLPDSVFACAGDSGRVAFCVLLPN